MVTYTKGTDTQRNRRIDDRVEVTFPSGPGQRRALSETPVPFMLISQGVISAWSLLGAWGVPRKVQFWGGWPKAHRCPGSSCTWCHSCCPQAKIVGRRKWLVFTSQQTMNTEKVKRIPKKIF